MGKGTGSCYYNLNRIEAVYTSSCYVKGIIMLVITNLSNADHRLGVLPITSLLLTHGDIVCVCDGGGGVGGREGAGLCVILG